MARVTNAMLASNYLTNMNRNLRNMQLLQSQLASGKAITKPSDDPYKASRTMQLYTEIDSNKQFNENIKDVSNWLDTTDTALNQAGNVFGRIRTLLMTAGNGAYGEDERKAINDEIKEKVNELSQILNTNFDGAYIFGGTKSTSKPVMVDTDGKIKYADKDSNPIMKTSTGFSSNLANPIISSVAGSTKQINKIEKTATGVTITIIDSASPATPITKTITPPNLAGFKSVIAASITPTPTPPAPTQDFSEEDAEKAFSVYSTLDQIGEGLNVEVSEGVLIKYNKTAVDILEYKDKSGTPQNVSDLLEAIEKNLGTPAATTAAFPGTPGQGMLTGTLLGQVDSVIENLLQRRSEVGAMTNRMESAQSKNEDENLNMKDILSKTEDIDFTEKMMDYSIMQTVYMASLQTSAKILPTTLLDYIR